MWIPLAILAILSLGGGLMFNVPEYLKEIFPAVHEGHNPILEYIAIAAGLLGIGLAYLIYMVKPGMADSIAGALKAPYQLVYNKYFVDEVYDATVVKPLVAGSRVVLWKGVDAGLIDGVVNGTGGAVNAIARSMRFVQSGLVRGYALTIFAGAVVLVGYLLWMR